MTWLRLHYDDPLLWAVLVVLAMLLVLEGGGLLAVVILACLCVALCGAAVKATRR